VDFKGNKAFSSNELREQVTFAQTGYVDQVEIQNTRDALRAYYETAGYAFATIQKTKVDELTERSRRIIFTIEEGPRAEIRSVEFEGVTQLEEAKLSAQLNTRPYGLLDVGGFLQRSQIEADLETVLETYKNRGYLDVSIPYWKLTTANERQDLFVSIVVDEGVQTTVSDIKLLVTDETGTLLSGEDVIISQAELRQTLTNLRDDFGLKTDGRGFSLPWVEAAQGAIIEKYQAQGFPKVKVTARCRPAGSSISWSKVPQCSKIVPKTPEGCLPSNNSERAGLCSVCPDEPEALCCQRTIDQARCTTISTEHHYDMALMVETGRRVRVGPIFLRGNEDTRDWVILGELTLEPGQLFHLRKVLESQSNVRNLQLFESVSIEAIGLSEDLITQASERELASLIVTVEEGPSWFLEVTVGLESRNLLTDEPRLLLTLEPVVTENNLWGLGKQAQLRFKYAFDPLETRRKFEASEEPFQELASIFFDVDRLVAAEFLYRDPRLTSLRLDTTLSFFATFDYLGAEINDLDKVEYGVRPTIRRNLLTYLLLQLSLEVTRTTTRNREEDPRNLEGERLFEPWRTTFTVSPQATYDRRDSPINPKSDYVADLKLDYTQGVRDSPIRFIRLTGTWSQYFSFPRSYPKSRRLVWAYGLQAGRVWPLAGTEEIPVDERFRLGGVGSLRGFADNAVGPLDANFQPLGGELLLVG
ncbi:MAG: POTRA domain-containing protein, partial [Myxococcota bacterium]